MKTILIVDDEVALAKALGRILDRDGFQTVIASSVDQALSVLREQTIDLCITDLSMPGQSGLDLLTTIRADEKLKSLPVIVISAFGSHEQRTIMNFSPLRILQKPADINEILWTVREGLGLPKTKP